MARDGQQHRPVALVILDGWGLAPPGDGNAVWLADTPTFDALMAGHPNATLVASGIDVGLPEGQIGNSEVGHLNLGAGRVVYQDLARIDRAVFDGSFAENAQLLHAARAAADAGSTFHVVGLVSTGGVHSHLRHIEAAVRVAADAGVRRVLVHAITDGRDVAPDAALTDIPALEAILHQVAETHDVDARIVTVIGRYWAMDRDRRWDRTERAYAALVDRLGTRAATASQAIGESQAHGVTDEFVEPWIITGPEGSGSDALTDGDVVFLANFRPDRMRQLAHALVDEHFEGFVRARRLDLHVLAMTKYESTLPLPVVFPPHDVHGTLADVLEAAGVGQLHVAETEKYAHVTYFFNGGVEGEHAGEVRALVDSPRDVATYDLKPQMSAAGVADRFVAGIADESVGFAVLNFANPDMVGHTGVIAAAVAACEEVDRQLARVLEAVAARGGVCIVTADHGNAETMRTPEGKPHTAHTTNRVPIVVTLPAGGGVELRDGRLADVAPTVLDLLGIEQPTEMTGVSLLARSGVAAAT